MGRERAVVAGEPGRGIVRILRMVEDGDAPGLPAELAGAIQPGCALSSDLLLAVLALGIGQLAAAPNRQALCRTNARQTGLVRGMERYRRLRRGAQHDLDIEQARFRGRIVESEGPRICQDDAAALGDPFALLGEAADLAAAGDVVELLVYDAARSQALQPEIVVVHAAMSKPDAVMVTMVHRRIGQQGGSVGRPQRIKIGFPIRRTEQIPGGLLASDADYKLSAFFKDLYHVLQSPFLFSIVPKILPRKWGARR